MRELPSLIFDKLLIFVISVVHVASCPDNLAERALGCMHEYNTLASSLTSRGQTFFSGHDVETIRSLCQHLKKDIRCAFHIKSSCPEAEWHIIENTVSSYASVYELCMYDNLFDVYARHQTCFQRIRPDTHLCYEEYRTSTDHLLDSVYKGNTDAKKIMCSHYYILGDCIDAETLRQCSPEAAQLADYLIPPSIAKSELCVEVATTTPISQPVADDHYEISQKTEDSLHIQNEASTITLAFSQLLSTFILHRTLLFIS